MNETLPIGTVLILKDAKKKVMITGYAPIDMENKDQIYRYLGCVYPEGIIKSDENILFNNSDIDKVFFKCYVNEEVNDYIKEVNRILNNENRINEILNELNS